MAEYIERTPEVILAANAGARAIENTRRYHGAIYCQDVFGDNPQEIPYMQAASMLRAFSELPAADVAPVVRCQKCEHSWEDLNGLCCSYGPCVDCPVLPDFWCAYGERREVT